MHQKKVLGVFALAMINVAAIVSLRNFPIMAEYGLGAIFFYVIAALTYFIPTALVSAELATALPQAGGPFRWVCEGLGPRWGFFAIWWSWMESIAWFPAILTFVGTTLAYLFNPQWAQHPLYLLGVMLAIFWVGTVVNFFGMEISSRVSSLGVLLGTLLPGVLIIGLGGYWLYEGHPSHLNLSFDALVPSLKMDNLIFYTGLLLGLAGIEMAAFHAQEATHPQRDYPRAIFLSTLVILTLSILGSLAIAVVLPPEQMNIVEGLMKTYETFFQKFQLERFVPVLAFFIVMGSMAGIATWIIGPAKGILASAEYGFIPRWLQKKNRYEVPVGTLLVQASIGSLLASAFMLMPNIQSAYWIVTVLSAQFALLMYILIFLAAIRLRITQPHLLRPYRVPGGAWGIWVIGGLGILSCLGAFILGFVPPQQLETGALWIYETYLCMGLGLLSLFPAVVCWRWRGVPQ